ncbi:MAG: metal-dependent phosphohydrolase, partial [Pseudomonadota bacterium]
MAAIVVAAMLLLGITVVVLGQIAARQTVLMTTAERLQDAGRLITEQTGRMLEPARATLLQMSFDPLTSATDLDARLQRAFVLIEPLAANKLLSSLYIGQANGDFLLARRLDSAAVRALVAAPAGAAFLLQSVSGGVHGQPGARAGEYIFYDTALRVIARSNRPDYRFDPRGRPWYRDAMATSTAVLSRPYVFFTTEQVGVSLSQRSRDGGAVVSVDVVLDDLAAHLAGMRFTRGTEIALIDADRKVLAYPDMGRVLLREASDRFGFRTIDMLGVDSLRRLSALPAATGQRTREASRFESDGVDWIGIATPFRFGSIDGMELLVAAPVDELAVALNGQQAHMLQIILLVAIVLLPFGWWAGKRIGQSMDQLIERARRIGRFDLGPQGPMPATWVREVGELASVMDGMVDTIDHFLQIGQQLATDTDMERMLGTVLQQVVETTRCDAGAVYLWHHAEDTMVRAAQAGTALNGLPVRMTRGSAARAERWTVEAAPGQRQVELALRGRNGQLQGLLVLQHSDDLAHAAASFGEFTERLSGMLAVSIETRQLVDAQQKLLDAVIRLMADAIDAKSPYTGGHCERVPELAMRMVERMHDDTDGPYRDFAMTADERYAFYLGAWLHDCGKVTSPEHIVDKATKLELIYNRIHEVRMRFEVLWRDAECAHLRRLLGGMPEAESLVQLHASQQKLQ